MEWIGIGLSAAGLVSAAMGWVHYLAGVPKGNVAVVPRAMMVAQFLAVLLPTVGIAWSVREYGTVSLGLVVLAGFAATFALLFVWLYTQRKTPLGHITVTIGDRLPSFSVTNSEGQRFDSSSFSGKRVLLKFFRGGW
jgi:hypothetical protein